MLERAWGFDSLRPQSTPLRGHRGGGRTLRPTVADTVLIHPNRDKPESRVTRTAVVVLLLASAALVALITAGGWAVLLGMEAVAILYVVVLVAIAYYVWRWRRGVLPLAAALAVLLAVVAAIAAPAWFARRDGFAEPLLDADMLGVLTLLVIPVQAVLVAFAMRGFNQAWNVEVELPRDEAPLHGGGRPSAAPL